MFVFDWNHKQFLSFGSNLLALGVTDYRSLHDIRESEEFSEVAEQFSLN
jgi:hypothetical protein